MDRNWPQSLVGGISVPHSAKSSTVQNEHVDTVTKKANNTLAFLRRNITSCPLDVKAQYATRRWSDQTWSMHAAAIWDPTSVHVYMYSELDSFGSSTVPGHLRINIFVFP